ncbi:MAG: DUF503 domain-containing protein [Planctomycetota bacterium]
MNSKFATGTLAVNIYCKDAKSLKEKRQIVKSVIAKLKNNYNISIKEVDNEDKWQLSTLAIAVVDKNEFMVHNIIENIINSLHSSIKLHVIDYTKEIL